MNESNEKENEIMNNSINDLNKVKLKEEINNQFNEIKNQYSQEGKLDMGDGKYNLEEQNILNQQQIDNKINMDINNNETIILMI